MDRNQTAAELAKEYESLAIAVTNDYCRLKRQDPVAGFPAVAKAIGFYTAMNVLWAGVARRLAEGPDMSRGDQLMQEQNQYWETVDPSEHQEEL